MTYGLGVGWWARVYSHETYKKWVLLLSPLLGKYRQKNWLARMRQKDVQ